MASVCVSEKRERDCKSIDFLIKSNRFMVQIGGDDSTREIHAWICVCMCGGERSQRMREQRERVPVMHDASQAASDVQDVPLRQRSACY